jgi:nucleoside 2-deoxyribosyltransferase
MIELQKFNLVYLASPYTQYELGLSQAFRDIAKIAGALISRGVSVYSPIAHCHPIAVYGGVHPAAHEIWMKIDTKMMAACDALCIARLPGWDKSAGVAMEALEFFSQKKPIYHLEPKTLEVVAA